MISDKRVDDALRLALEAGEVGIQVAAYLGEELIVDTWVGARDSSGAAVEQATLFPIFSMSKALISALTLIRAEQGYFGIDDPIAQHWPEYGCHGKEKITIRHVLAHKAGVPQMPSWMTTDEHLADWGGIIHGLEQMVPLNAPMERAQYHGVSTYYILGEVLRRTDHARRMFDEIFTEEISVPLGIENDIWWRLPPEQDYRMAELTYGANPPASFAPPGMAEKYAIMCPPAHNPVPDNHNRPAVRRLLEGQVYATAMAGARFWSLFANGGKFGDVQLLSEKTVAALAIPSANPELVDEFRGIIPRYSLGFRVSAPDSDIAPVVGPGPRIIAVTGGGGTLGWADLDTRLAVTYTHNRMASHRVFVALGDALRAVASEHE